MNRLYEYAALNVILIFFQLEMRLRLVSEGSTSAADRNSEWRWREPCMQIVM